MLHLQERGQRWVRSRTRPRAWTQLAQHQTATTHLLHLGHAPPPPPQQQELQPWQAPPHALPRLAEPSTGAQLAPVPVPVRGVVPAADDVVGWALGLSPSAQTAPRLEAG